MTEVEKIFVGNAAIGDYSVEEENIWLNELLEQ